MMGRSADPLLASVGEVVRWRPTRSRGETSTTQGGGHSGVAHAFASLQCACMKTLQHAKPKKKQNAAT